MYLKKPKLYKSKIKNKENIYYQDISWLMSKIDPVSILERLNVRIFRIQGDQIDGWCPDHHLFTKKEPSHPKWSLNIKTGQTNCFTEARGSNLLWTICRLRKCDPKLAIEWMLGDANTIDISLIDKMQREFKKIVLDPPKQNMPIFPETEEWFKFERMQKSGYDYFMYPPHPKLPTLIEKETVDKYRCLQLNSGQYKDRVIIPFFVKEKVFGYEALDIFGEKKWLEIHPESDKNQYRKVLYPSGFKRKLTLFGIDFMNENEQIILVEGARDAMKLYQLGYKACAILGSSISNEQIILLSEKNPSEIILFFDGDRAGISIKEKCKSKLDEFFNVKSINTPEGIQKI